LVLHPVFYPNHGPLTELTLSEEAIGLAKSMRWEVSQGPLWTDENEQAMLDSFKEPNVTLKEKKSMKDGDYVYTDMM
jgi:hypothetical protein